MPIVLFLTYINFQVVALIMLNAKLPCLWPELLLTAAGVARPQSCRPPEFNLSANSSLHSPQVLLAGMKTDKMMFTLQCFSA